jgi:hypothetical protein
MANQGKIKPINQQCDIYRNLPHSALSVLTWTCLACWLLYFLVWFLQQLFCTALTDPNYYNLKVTFKE